MAFERVYLQTNDGARYGPVPFSALVEWHIQGRVPPDALLLDAETYESRPITDFPPLAVPPPVAGVALSSPAPPSAPGNIGHLIPTRNTNSLIAYYLGCFAWLPCLSVLLAPFAIYFGVRGLRDAETVGVGRKHALVGIISGAIGILIILVTIYLWATDALFH